MKALALLIAAPVGAAIAQEPAAEPTSRTCAFPAPIAGLEDKPVLLTLTPLDTTQRLPVSVLALVAQVLARPLQRIEEQPDGQLLLTSADDEFSFAVLRTATRFTLRGDGTISDVSVRGAGEPAFSDTLRNWLETLSGTAGLGSVSPEGAALEIPLAIAFRTAVDTAFGQAPLFRIRIPEEKQARLAPGARPPPYPDEALWIRAEGTVILTFVVDERGRVDPGTIRSIEPPAPLGPELRPIFRAFERAARRAALEYEYVPAQVLGCHVRMWVRQPFTFRVKR